MRKNKNIITETSYEDYGIYDISSAGQEKSRFQFFTNIICIFAIAVCIMIVTDVICITKYNKGPYFAIRTKIYDDGGTQEFYGLGYKVIKYHQQQGRQDSEIGFWSMKYSIDPIELSVLELAIEFRNNPEQTANKYAGQFMKVTGNFYKTKDGQPILIYNDPDNAYTLKIKCLMADTTDLSSYQKGEKITVLGTMKNFTLATKEMPNSANMSNCFIEQ